MDENLLAEARKQLSQLAEVLPAKGRVMVIPHDYPDPDALAAAAAMHLLLAERYHLQSQIVFTGIVSRAENRELLRTCRYRWHLLSEIRPLKHRVPCVLVDTAPWSGNVTVPSYGKPVAVIDHHPFKPNVRWAAIFADVRPGTGATASILYQYLAAAEVPIPKWLASIMTYAIASETLDFSRHRTDLDFEAYTSLIRRANMRVIGEMRHARLPRSYFVQLQEAIRNAFVHGRAAWTHLNAVEQPEIVAEVADLLLRMERIHWSFCTAYHQENLIISLRSSARGARCGGLLKRLVRKNGSVGGHHRMAAGYLDMQGLTPQERDVRRDAFVRSLLARIERRPAQDESVAALAHPLVDAGTGD
jgi:nanoRNase/pAp phosphatase (c-di-AMP/oligoRNAs hydrolase)